MFCHHFSDMGVQGFLHSHVTFPSVNSESVKVNRFIPEPQVMFSVTSVSEKI